MHTLSRRLLPAALALGGLAALAAAPAHAQNLVKDGGFEQADTSQATYNLFTPFDTSWIVTQGDVGIFTTNPSGAFYDPNFVFDGNNSLYLTYDTSGTSEIAQGLATTPGQSYTLSFYADDFASQGSQLLNVNFGNTVVSGGPITVPLDPGGVFATTPAYTFFSYTVTAATPFTGLTFAAADDGSNNIALDDISVVPAAVPEASTTVSFGLLLMLGMGGLALAAKKKAGAAA